MAVSPNRKNSSKLACKRSDAESFEQNWLRKRSGAPPIQRIASVDASSVMHCCGAVAVGAATVFNYPGEHDPSLLVRLTTSEFVAFTQNCTHLVFVLILVMLQLWLLTATINAWLGGDDSVVWPATAASATCLALNLGLLNYLGHNERTRKG
jgi:hypothetical protein